jgi:rhodanese-related sulfurtransferase
MNSITVEELKKKLGNKEDIKVIDVREDYEVEEANFGADHIPMGSIIDRIDEIPKDKEVIVHCRSGKRSASVIDSLERMYGYDNLYNLEGGIKAWADKIDSSLDVS